MDLSTQKVEVKDNALFELIQNYCREAGVRNLQKHIEKIYRKVALQLVGKGLSYASPFVTAHHIDKESIGSLENESSDKLENKLEDGDTLLKQSASIATSQQDNNGSETVSVERIIIDESNLFNYVGKPVFHTERLYDQTPTGVVMGLAWTSMGGSTLYIETSLVEQEENKGSLMLTGQLGDVMKESAQIAHTVARSLFTEKEPDNSFFADSKIHLHVPSGATPKDGPSAGCTMITSMLSLAMKKPVKKDIAMTGEVTLTGKILPIGGVKEKTIAARRSGVETLIFPTANKRDYDELADSIKDGFDVHFVGTYNQIFELAFESKHA